MARYRAGLDKRIMGGGLQHVDPHTMVNLTTDTDNGVMLLITTRNMSFLLHAA